MGSFGGGTIFICFRHGPANLLAVKFCQAVARHQAGSSKPHTLVSRHHIQEKRVLTGLEALKFVGFQERVLKDYRAAVGGSRSHPGVDGFFLDLAGNAWSGPCCLAIIMSILARCTSRHVQCYGAGRLAEAVSSQDDDGALAAVMDM
jgi:hypothetical protein